MTPARGWGPGPHYLPVLVRRVPEHQSNPRYLRDLVASMSDTPTPTTHTPTIPTPSGAPEKQ